MLVLTINRSSILFIEDENRWVQTLLSTLYVKTASERLELILQAPNRSMLKKATAIRHGWDRRTCGIATATIYAHFASKEALMVPRSLGTRLPADCTRRKTGLCVGEGKCHWEAHSHLFISRAKRFFSTGACRFSMLWVILPRHSMQCRLQSAMQEIAHAFTDMLAQVVEQGKADGEFDPAIAHRVMLKGWLVWFVLRVFQFNF